MTPGLPHVHLWDFSRLSFVNTVLSKRKLTWFVDNGKVRAAAAGAAPCITLKPPHFQLGSTAVLRPVVLRSVQHAFLSIRLFV